MEEDKYPRITKDQLEVWLDSPVTQTYLQSLGWAVSQIEEVLGRGGHVDSSNSDLTQARIHSALGEKRGLLRASNPELLLTTHEMIGGNSDIED